jgi:plastocyanin
VRKLAALAVVAMLAVALTVSSVAFGATKRVGVRGFAFTPKTITIKRGDTVRWSWAGRIPHNVRIAGKKSRTANRLTYRRKFTRRGTYRYVCTLHTRQNMRGTVRVR